MSFGISSYLLAWYPASGYRDSSGYLKHVGGYGSYWSVSPNGSDAYRLFFESSDWIRPAYNGYRAYGNSVRCIKESK